MENEHDPLLKNPTKPSKQCLNVQMKVMLYSLIYNCASTITVMTEPQYVYDYLKNMNTSYTYTKGQNVSLLETKSCTINSTQSNEKLRQLSTDWSWYMQLAEAGVALPVVMFSGSIADRIGRKSVLMWNLIVTFIAYALKTFVVYRNMNLYYYTICCAILGIAGSHFTYQIANFAILSDNTDSGKERSFIMTLYDAVAALGVVVFQIGMGYGIQLINFTIPYILSTCFLLLMCILVQITLTETWKPAEKLAKFQIKDVTLELFSFCIKGKNMNDSFKSSSFILKFVAYCLFYGPHTVVWPIITIFQLGVPFCLTAEQIGWFSAIARFVAFIGGVIILKIINTFCEVKDEVITILGMFSCLATYIIYGVSFNDWILYGAIPAGVIRVLPISLLRALMSKMVRPDKQGVLYSVLHVMQVIDIIGGSTLFNNIYHQTLPIYNGLVFFVMGGIICVALALMLCVCCHSPATNQSGEQNIGAQKKEDNNEIN